MKAKKFSPLWFYVTLFFLSQGIYSQTELKKEFHKEFQTGPNTVLNIDNKYGNVDMQDWDKDLIQIDVVVIVKNSSSEKAERLLSYIDVVLNAEGDEVTAKTVFDERFEKSSSWRDDNDLKIDYTVKMPKSIALNLYNKYGNVFISELTGRATIGVKYGKLKANRIYRGNEDPLTVIDLGYSDASIEESSWLKVTMKYSTLSLGNSTAVVLISKYSKIFIDDCSSLVIEGKYDTYEFGSLSNLVASCSYSGFKIKEVKEKLSLETEYTDCRIEYIPPTFKSIEINTRYGGYRLGIDEAASYQLDGQADYAKIYYPDEGKVSKIAENTSTKVYGTVGKNTNPEATVKVVTKYGSVKLNE